MGAARDLVTDEKTRRRVAALAKGLTSDPAREQESRRHHRAIIDALNASHTNGEQDALTVLEGCGRTLATLLGGLDERHMFGALAYIAVRAMHHAPEYQRQGAVARFEWEID